MQTVYTELRTLASFHFNKERTDHSLQPTALVNEAYLRLVTDGKLQKFENRGHFFSAAAEAMRRILVDSARARQCLKRGGELRRIDLGDLVADDQCTDDLLLDLETGLCQLKEVDADSAELIKLRLFAGLSVSEAGDVMGLSRTAAYRTWEFARSWFGVYLRE